ncbi:MBL fold metallo-hydrolase [Streptomyces tanashiensis]
MAEDLGPRKVVAVHTDSWNIYRDTRSLAEAFRAQGIAAELVDLAPDGTPKSLS